MKFIFTVLCFCLLFEAQSQTDSSSKSKAWLGQITPFYVLSSYGGLTVGVNKLQEGITQKGWGVLTPGFPYANYSLNIKKKFYIGGMIGEQLGLAHPTANNFIPIGRLNFGITAAWQFNKHCFLAVNHYRLSQYGIYVNEDEGSGWVVGGTLRYKRLMIEVANSLKGTAKSGPLNGRMSSNYWQVFPKYLFQHNSAKVPFWIGLRFESYENRVVQNALSKQIMNFEFLIGKLIPINPK